MKNHWKLTLQKGAVREEVFFEKKLHCDANCEHCRAIISNLLWTGVIFENILNASLRGRTELGSCGISPSAARWVAHVPCNTWARFIGGIDPDGWVVSDETSKHFFSARRFERATPKRPSIVKCLAVKGQPKMQHCSSTTENAPTHNTDRRGTDLN